MPPQDITGAQPSMTVQQGKHTTVLEMEFCVLDFCLVTDSVYRSDYADPESVLVLLTNDLVRRKKQSVLKTCFQVAIDCKSTGLPSHENPYAMDFQVDAANKKKLINTSSTFQESAVTCCEYVVDCPPDVRKYLHFIFFYLQPTDFTLPFCCWIKRQEVLWVVFKVRLIRVLF